MQCTFVKIKDDLHWRLLDWNLCLFLSTRDFQQNRETFTWDCEWMEMVFSANNIIEAEETEDGDQMQVRA